MITGASMGIGLELAHVFASHGHDLVLVARSRDLLEALSRELEAKYRITATAIASDLAEREAPQALSDELAARSIQVEFLVNNAGFGLRGEFRDTDIARELNMIQLNIATLTHLTKLILPQMLERGSGRIMQVASIAAFQPGPLMAVYYASKAYVLSFSQALAEELRGSGVTVTALCPGPTATNFAKTALMESSWVFVQAGPASGAEVARYGYAAMMRGQRIAIPSFRDRVLMQAQRFIPRAVVTRIVKVIQENR